jgi:tetratricopeptide (TPR) repeat protein
MDKLTIKYATYAKGLPPQPIKLKTPGWAGAPEKMEDGSSPQPWHCLPFAEGSMYGLELVYPYENECHVINDGTGPLRFEWDFAGEPGGGVTGGEFVPFAPRRNPKFYLFSARIDLQPPPGQVIRIEPHPRVFTDETGTVPLAVIGHLQNEWWPRLVFSVFKVPAPGQRHVFRKGEPYAQVIFVPQRVGYELTRMSKEEESQRRELERQIEAAKNEIADNVWMNVDGSPLGSHYKVMARAFAKDGAAGVEAVVDEAMTRYQSALPRDASVGEALAAARRLIDERKFSEARDVYNAVLARDPQNADAMSHLGICFACLGSPVVGLNLMTQAVALQPHVPLFHGNRGELLRLMGRYAEAEASIRAALRLTPDDPLTLSVLGLVLAQQGRADEGLEACRAALAIDGRAPLVHLRMGTILAGQSRDAEARAAYEAALAIDPGFFEAKQALRALPAVPKA